MSVYIKGMEMPEDCTECWFKKNTWHQHLSDCNICPFTGDATPYTRRKENCPLVSVPDHGRLIDGNALVEWICGKDYMTKVHTASKEELRVAMTNIPIMINNAPTIIPATAKEDEA